MWVLRFLTAALIILAVFLRPCYAEESDPLAPQDMSSPRSTLQSFAAETHVLAQLFADYRIRKTNEKFEKLYEKVTSLRAFFDLSEVPSAIRTKIGGASVTMLADILVRLPEGDLQAAPSGEDFDPDEEPAFWVIPYTEISLVRLAEDQKGTRYIFSSETVERLPEFHEKIIDRPPVRPTPYKNFYQNQIDFTGPWIPYAFVTLIPTPLRATFLGTARWKVLLAVVAATLLIWLNLLWAKTVRKFTHKSSKMLTHFLGLTKPLFLISSSTFLHITFNKQFNLQGSFAEGEFLFFAIILYLSGIWAVWNFSVLSGELFIESPRIDERSLDANLLRLVSRILGLLTSCAVLIYGANEIGIPAIGLVAGLGVGGLAVGLAARPTIENLLGGLSLFADRPFHVGDYIIYGNSSGIVESIGARSSRIRALDGPIMTIPNADLATMQIVNFSDREKFLFSHVLGLRHETSRNQFEWLLSELRKVLSAHPLVEEQGGFPRVRMIGFGASAIELELRAYVVTSDYAKFLEIQEHLIFEIMRAVEEAGTSLAFTSQTTYLTRDRGVNVERVRNLKAQEKSVLAEVRAAETKNPQETAP